MRSYGYGAARESNTSQRRVLWVMQTFVTADASSQKRLGWCRCVLVAARGGGRDTKRRNPWENALMLKGSFLLEGRACHAECVSIRRWEDRSAQVLLPSLDGQAAAAAVLWLGMLSFSKGHSAHSSVVKSTTTKRCYADELGAYSRLTVIVYTT